MPLENEVVTLRADDVEALVSMLAPQLDDFPVADQELVQRVHLALHADRKPAEEAAVQADAGPAGDGQFMIIAFMGHIEREGYVTEITLGGEPGYHIDLPDKLWGGNPYAWEEYSAKALFSRCPVPEETVRVRWEADCRRAAEHARREAEWRGMQEQRALESGSEDLDNQETEF